MIVTERLILWTVKSNNHIMRGILFKLYATLGMVLLCIFSFAQPGDPGNNPEVPLGGIEWLLLGGAAYGAKKAYDNYRKRK